LILQERGIEFSGVAALLVGKAVLVTDNLPFMRRFDGAPMIQPILFKSAIYWLCVLIVRLAEELVHFVAAGGAIAADSLRVVWPLIDHHHPRELDVVVARARGCLHSIRVRGPLAFVSLRPNAGALSEPSTVFWYVPQGWAKLRISERQRLR
jgi:hypothetical protein